MHMNRAARFLPAGSSIAQRIEDAYPGLSDALRRFADFVVAEPVKVVQMSIGEVVREAGVSVATANRLARRLGFDGYPAFRADVLGAFEDVLAPVERLRQRISDGSSSVEIVAASIEEDLTALTSTLAHLDMERVEQLVSRIVAARRVYVAGFDNAGALGWILANRLAILGKPAASAGAGGRLSAARELAGFGPEDLVIAIAFPRYIRDTVDVARAAAARGVPVAAITDGQGSPIAPLAVVPVYLQARRVVGSTSDTAILSFLEALAAAVGARLPGAAAASADFADMAFPWLISSGRD